MNHYIDAWKKAFDFKGRASRKAFWSFFFINLFILIACAILNSKTGFEGIFNISLGWLYFFVQLLPHTAILIRRIRDTNASEYLWLLFIPLLGYFLLLLFCLRSTAGLFKLEIPYSDATKELFSQTSVLAGSSAMIKALESNNIGITLDSNLFFTERNFEIFDMDREESILNCEEEEASSLDGFLRFTSLNKASAAQLKVLDASSNHRYSVYKTRGRIFSTFYICDNEGKEIGILKAEGSDILALDSQENELFKVKSQSSLSLDHYIGLSKSKDVLFTIDQKSGENIKGKSAFTNSIFLTVNEQIPKDSPLRIWFLSSLIFFYMLKN